MRGREFGKFVAGIAACEHVENTFENRTGERSVRRGGADEIEEFVDGPGVEGNDGDNLLRENIEGIARVVDGFNLPFIHGAGDGGAGGKVASIFGINDGVTNGADAVTGSTHALHAAGDGGRRFDLHHEIDRAHVDAEFDRGGGDESAQRAHLEAVFDLLALVGGNAAVMRADQRLSGEFVDRAGNALGESAAVDED